MAALRVGGGEPTTEDLLRAVEATTMVERYDTPEQQEALAARGHGLVTGSALLQL